MLVSAADHSNQPILPSWGTPSEWPWTLTMIIMEARRILSFFQLPKASQPPKAIWHSSEKCANFIEASFKNPGQDKQYLEFNDSEVEG